jgi:hypothetical protein
MKSLIQFKSPFKFAAVFCAGAFLVIGAGVASAQIGSGWTQYFPSKAYNSGMSQSQRYSISGNVEHFWTYDTDTDEFPGEDSGPRSEWRVNNNYTTGSEQFQGDLNPESGSTSCTVMQIFGGTSTATSIMLQMRSGDGTLRHYNDTALATGCWGIYTRVNVVHYPVSGGTGSIEVWINGSKKATFNDAGYTTHYFKYGVYDIVSSAPHYNGIYWRGVSFFKGGNSSNGIDTSAEYQLQNQASGLVLNQQGSLNNGTPITQWSSVSSDNLRWTFIPTSGGYYRINSVKSGKDAVVLGASTAQGAGIIQYDFGSAENDQWLPQHNSDGSYTFVNRHSGLVLEDPASSTSTSTQMDQWGANGGANQKWKLIKQ